MKKRITEKDYVKAHRTSSRREEIERHGHPVPVRHVHRSKKAYDRRKEKAAIKRGLFHFPATGLIARAESSPYL